MLWNLFNRGQLHCENQQLVNSNITKSQEWAGGRLMFMEKQLCRYVLADALLCVREASIF